MFTRVVEMTSKSGKSQELANIIDEKGVPISEKSNAASSTRLCRLARRPRSRFGSELLEQTRGC